MSESDDESNKQVSFARIRYKHIFKNEFFAKHIEDIFIKNNITKNLSPFEPEDDEDFVKHKFYWTYCPNSEKNKCTILHDHEKDKIQANILFLASKFYNYI